QDFGLRQQQGREHRHPRHGPGPGALAGRSGPAVRPLSAAFGQTHRRREFHRVGLVDRQAYYRHARWRGDRREQRSGPRLDLHHYVACNRVAMSQSQHIIIVDDEAPAREMVGDYLRMHGFAVTLCDGGKSLRSAIEAGTAPDLVVLDLNMPEEDGLSIIRDLKSRTNVPVIMLTATASPIDRVVGLELGADDYVAKPCELRELMARIRSVL